MGARKEAAFLNRVSQEGKRGLKEVREGAMWPSRRAFQAETPAGANATRWECTWLVGEQPGSQCGWNGVSEEKSKR